MSEMRPRLGPLVAGVHFVATPIGAARDITLRALDVLGLDSDADFDAVKRAWRNKAKEVHPDVRPGDAEAASGAHDRPARKDDARQRRARRRG